MEEKFEHFTITGEFSETPIEKHLNYPQFNELVSLIGSFLADNELYDPVRLELAVPHESFRNINTSIQNELGQESVENIEKQFEVSYDERFSVLIIDKDSIEQKIKKWIRLF